MKNGPILLIEDDADDRQIFKEVLHDLNISNSFISFDQCAKAFEYLEKTTDQPFIIFCDINVPGMNGIEFKRRIDSDPFLRKKSIPFVFYSTSAHQHMVNEAYTQMTVQGFFQKKSSYSEIKNNIGLIIDYWKACIHPNAG